MPRVPVAPLVLTLAAALPLPLPATAQDRMPPDAAAMPQPRYADFAQLVLAAPLVVDATVHSQVAIDGPEAAGVAQGFVRLYVQADVNALVTGSAGLPPRIGYLVDVPLAPDGRAPRLRQARVLLFARPVADRPDQLQLVAPDAQRRWTPAADALTRQIASAALASDAPPVVTGIGNAFHVPGSLPGESETQIFLTTADNRPISLSILRRPGEQPRWGVALSEITDAAAAPPAPDTLLWYRLACFLPAQLPDSSLASADPADADSARADYQFVLQSLGPCDRRAAY